MIGVIFLRSTMIDMTFMPSQAVLVKQCSQGSQRSRSMPSLWRSLLSLLLLWRWHRLEGTCSDEVGPMCAVPRLLEFVSRQWIWSFMSTRPGSELYPAGLAPLKLLLMLQFLVLGMLCNPVFWLSTQQTWEGAHLITGSHGPHDKRVGLYSALICIWDCWDHGRSFGPCKRQTRMEHLLMPSLDLNRLPIWICFYSPVLGKCYPMKHILPEFQSVLCF